MFDNTTKESCTVCVAELANDTTSGRQDQPSAARADRETVTGDYEPVDKVPFPNSSRIIRERSVQFLKANET